MITDFIVLVMLAQASAIEGQVRDARTHNTIASVKVELSYEGIPLDTQYTGPDGRFRFASVIPYSYAISAVYDGYNPAAVELEIPTPVIIELTRTIKPSRNAPPVVSLREYMAPENARKEFDRARKEMHRRDCTKAIGHLENGLRAFGQDASALNDLGNCYRKLGKLDGAEESFKRAIALSDSAYIAMNLAEVYTTQKRFKEAETVLLGAIQRTPQNGDAYYELAVAHFKEGRFEEAEMAALRAHAHPHRVADVHLLLAKVYLHKNGGSAVEQLKLYLKEAPNGAESERVRKALEAR